jgi:hypothetical protein
VSASGGREAAKRCVRVLSATLATACALAAAAPLSAHAFGPLLSFGSFGARAGQMGTPGDLDIAPDGSLYVPDFFNNRVDVFSPQGEFRFAFGKEVNPAGGDLCTTATGCRSGVKSAVAGGMENPGNLAVSSGGEVYVSGALANRVDVFSPQGAFQFAFGKGVNPGGGDTCTTLTGCRAGIDDDTAGSLDPLGLAVDSAGSIYIGGTNGRIDVFDRFGVFQFAFGKNVNNRVGNPDVCTTASGCRKGLFTEAAGGIVGFDVDVTAAGDVVALDPVFQRVSVFSPQGEFRFAFGKGVNPAGGDVCTVTTGCQDGGAGTGAGEIGDALTALTVAPSGHLYVTGQLFERVDEFTAAGEFVRGFGAGVVDGQEMFQVCTLATGCRAGLRAGDVPGATGVPRGVAIDASGGIYVTEGEPTRIERFGEPPIPPPPPPPPNTPPTRPPSGPPAPPRPISNQFAFGKLKLNKRSGTAMLTVMVPGPGGLVLTGKGIRQAQAGAGAAGGVALPIRLSGRAKARLVKTGKAKVQALVTFAPTGGEPRTEAKPLLLKKLRP